MVSKDYWLFREIVLMRSIWVFTLIFGFLLINNLFFGSFYLVLVLFSMLAMRKIICTHCYYYGKWCGFAGGKLAACLFKKSNREGFNKKDSFIFVLTWILITVYPLIMSIYLSTFEFLFSFGYVCSILIFHIAHMVDACVVCKMNSDCPSGKIACRLLK